MNEASSRWIATFTLKEEAPVRQFEAASATDDSFEGDADRRMTLKLQECQDGKLGCRTKNQQHSKLQECRAMTAQITAMKPRGK